MIDSSKIK